MRKTINKVKVQGRIYEHNLSLKQVQNKESANYGKDFIGGTIDVATDDECLNVVTVNFTYVVPTWPAKNGKPERPNDTFVALKKIIDSGKTVLVDGKDAATIVDIDTSIALNDFYTDRNGEEELVSAKRAEGGFVRILSSMRLAEKDRSKFEVDMLINGTNFVEANEERGTEEYLSVKGAVFNFRNDILPLEFKVYNPDGIKYFEGLEAGPKSPVFTKVWGPIKSQNIVTQKVEESAFGEAAVTEYTRTVREWIIEGTNSPDKVYEVGDEENGITADEIKAAIEKRNVDLAEVKRRSDEYKAQKAAGTTSTVGTTAAAGGFDF